MVDNGNYEITANGVMIEEGGENSTQAHIFRHACFPVKRHEIRNICIYCVLLSNSVTTHAHIYKYNVYVCV